MARPDDIFCEIPEGDFPVTWRQITKPGGTLLVQADVDEIELRVYDLEVSKTEAIWPDELDPTEVMFDAPLLDEEWSLDGIGYNFRHELAAEGLFFYGGRTYYAEYTFVRTNGARPTYRTIIKTLQSNRP